MYPIEVKARALSIFQEGYGRDTVRARLLQELGHAPAEATLSEWRNQAALSGLIRTQSEELAIRYGRLLHRAADHYEQMPPSELVKHTLPMNAVRGTNQDKLDRLPVTPGGNVYVFLQAPGAEQPMHVEPNSGMDVVPSHVTESPRSGMVLDATSTEVKD